MTKDKYVSAECLIKRSGRIAIIDYFYNSVVKLAKDITVDKLVNVELLNEERRRNALTNNHTLDL